MPRQGTSAAGRGGRGALGGAVDTTPTGNVGADIVKAINATMIQNRQNAAANALMNQGPTGQPGGGITQNLGQLPSDGGPQDLTMPANTGLGPNVGSLVHTGGTGELAMQQQLNQQNLADQVQRAKVGAQLALTNQRLGLGGGRGGGGGGGGGGGTGNANRWQQYLAQGGDGGQGSQNVPRGTKTGKPAAYQPFQYDAATDPRADSFNNVAADFDSQFGKGMYGKVVPNLANVQPDDKGNYVIPSGKVDKDGNPVGPPLLTLSPNDANYWINRLNASRVAAGQQPIGPPAPGANPQSGQPAGTETNPYKPGDNLGLRALPYNSYVIDPQTGQTVQKLPLPKQPQGGQPQTQAPQTGQAQELSDVIPDDLTSASPDVSAQGTPQLAGMTAPNTSSSFDLGQPTGGVSQDTSLADAIRQAGIANQLRGIA